MDYSDVKPGTYWKVQYLELNVTYYIKVVRVWKCMDAWKRPSFLELQGDLIGMDDETVGLKSWHTKSFVLTVGHGTTVQPTTKTLFTFFKNLAEKVEDD